MELNQEKAAVGTWRLFKVVPAALEIAPRHHAVFGVEGVGRELVPAVAAFTDAAIGLRTFEAKRKATLAELEANIERLRVRTGFWLTYVRMSLPNYGASDVPGAWGSADVVIDRARGVIEVARSYSAETAPEYAAPLLSELGPLHEQCVRERTLERDLALELQRWQDDVRASTVRAFRAVSTLRRLLRNALGATHVDVRALNTEPPARTKKAEEAAAKRKAAKEQKAKEKADKAAAKKAAKVAAAEAEGKTEADAEATSEVAETKAA